MRSVHRFWHPGDEGAPPQVASASPILVDVCGLLSIPRNSALLKGVAAVVATSEVLGLDLDDMKPIGRAVRLETAGPYGMRGCERWVSAELTIYPVATRVEL